MNSFGRTTVQLCIPRRCIREDELELGLVLMQCRDCQSTHDRKNGKRRGKQNYICVSCSRQFIDSYNLLQGYSNDLKQQWLTDVCQLYGFYVLRTRYANEVLNESQVFTIQL